MAENWASRSPPTIEAAAFSQYWIAPFPIAINAEPGARRTTAAKGDAIMKSDTRHGKRKPEDRPAPLPTAITYALPDASRISGLSQATLRRRAADGALRLSRVGGRTLLNGDSLRALLSAEG